MFRKNDNNTEFIKFCGMEEKEGKENRKEGWVVMTMGRRAIDSCEWI